MTLRVLQIQSEKTLIPYRASLFALLKLHWVTLLDDGQQATPQRLMNNPDTAAALLLENTLSAMPYLWLLVDENNRVWAAGALTDIQPGRHGFLHGVSDPDLNPKWGITQTFLALADMAFNELNLLSIKAEFEAHNRGATGFCRRLGFRKVALRERDIRVQGQLYDVALYTLSAERFRENNSKATAGYPLHNHKG